MARRGQRDLGKERFWRRMVKGWRRSGLTVRDYCELHDLSEPSFFAWRRLLAERDAERPAPPPSSAHSDTGPAFVPVHLTPALPPAGPAIELVLGSGRVLGAGFDPLTYLRDVLTRWPSHLVERREELLPHRWQATPVAAAPCGAASPAP